MVRLLLAFACALVTGCAAHGEGAQDGVPMRPAVQHGRESGARLPESAVVQTSRVAPQDRVEGLVRDLQPGETVKVLRVEHWRALNAVGGPQRTLAMLATCESGIEPSKHDHILDVDGTPSLGAFRVKPQFHGPVPPDLEGQARQAVAIIEKLGTAPWTAADGCKEWNAR